jgi:hypothetical protein
MTLSPADWLALREPADASARSDALTRAIADRLPRDRPSRILDLATGTGSNVRYLALRVPSQQRWLVVDRNPGLLADVATRTFAWARAHSLDTTVNMKTLVLSGEGRTIEVERQCLDLATLEPSLFENRDLVTASAMFDLVSEGWLKLLAERCSTVGSLVLFALTYNGAFECSPADPEDETVRTLMNRHQKTNNVGLGAAEGPDAGECAARCFAAAGYEILRERSNWVLEPSSQPLQQALIEGWAQAAAEIAPELSGSIQAWLNRRLTHVSGQRSRVVVGHEDIAAWMPTATSTLRNAP